MELSNLSVLVQAGDEVRVRYLPARVERHSDGFEMDYPEWLSLWLGNVSIGGRPAAVVELLGRALREAYAACGVGPALSIVTEGGER